MLKIMQNLSKATNQQWNLLSIKQAILADRPPRKFSDLSRIWLLRGITLWTLWIARNDKVFNQHHWTPHKVESVVWQGLTDYVRIAWDRTLNTNSESSWAKAIARFESVWSCHELLCRMVDGRVI